MIIILPYSIGQATQPALPGDTAIPFGNNPAAGKYYAVRSIKIYVEEYGKGSPLIMIHGNGGSGGAFKFTAPYFMNQYRVILPDSRSQGKSIDTGDSLSFEMIADDLAALMDAMHIDSAYILGTSDGGIVGLVLAMRHPDKVIKLAETGADLVPDSTGIAIVHSKWLRSRQFYEENKNKVFTDPVEKNHWKVKMLDWMQPNIPFSMLQAIRCPTLVITGDHDMFKIEHALHIYEHISQSYLWVIPNSGHSTYREHAALFNQQVEKFFSEPFKQRQKD